MNMVITEVFNDNARKQKCHICGGNHLIKDKNNLHRDAAMKWAGEIYFLRCMSCHPYKEGEFEKLYPIPGKKQKPEQPIKSRFDILDL